MLDVLPTEIKTAWLALPAQRREAVTELRFRMGREAAMVLPWGEQILRSDQGGITVTDRLLRELYDRATGFSPYAMRIQETGLYLPLKDGCRMGICGEVTVRDGAIHGISHISSLAIRMAREHRGIAREAAERLVSGKNVDSCLILSPPGYGKTSFLRDLVRCVSEMGFRVSVSDERRELSAMEKGVPQLDLGPCTDVLVGLKKTEGVPLLIRAMNPQVVALDELSGGEELMLIREAAASGAAVFATVHSRDLHMLRKKPQFDGLLKDGYFSWCVTIQKDYHITMERLESNAEICGSGPGDSGLHADWLLGGTEPPAGSAAAAAAVSGAGDDGKRDGADHAPADGAV